MASKILGIDIRVRAVKVVEISKTPKGPVLEHWAMAEIPAEALGRHPEQENAQASALKDLLHKNKFTCKRAVITIGGPDVIIKRITLPPMPPNERPRAIRLQMEKFLPYAAEDALIDFYGISSGNSPNAQANGGKKSPATYESHEYLVACASAEAVRHLLDVGKKAGLKVVSVSAAPVSLKSAYQPLLGSEDTAVIYLGKHSTNIAVFRDKELFLNREIGLGGDSITQAMTGTVVSDRGKIELDFAAAEKLKLEEGIPLDFEEYTRRTGVAGDELFAMMRPAVEKIETEILRSFEYFGLKNLRIIMTGGASRTKQLPEAIAAALKMPVERSDPPIASPKNAGKYLGQLSAAIGAGLDEGKKINLLPEEYKNRWAAIAGKIYSNPVYIGSAAAVAAVLIFIYQSLVLSGLQKELAFERARYMSEEPAVKTSQAINRSLQGSGDIGGDQFVVFLKDLESVVPANTWLTKIEYSRSSGKLIINGISAGAVTELASSLKSNPIINSAEIAQFSKTRDREGYFEFSILCGVRK